mgnify:CR=1 FL=1
MKKGLGKGLGALLNVDTAAAENEIVQLKINEIEPNKNQPRKDFDEEKLRQLAESIKHHGVVQPVIVKKSGDVYNIVAGERRWRAARIAGLDTIPAIVGDYDDRQVMEIALIENLQREDLNPIEESEAYEKLINEFKLTQEDLAGIMGKSRPYIANALRLNKLEDEIKDFVRNNLLSGGHARALLALENKNDRLKLANEIIKKGLSVRETEFLVKNYTLMEGKARRTRKQKKSEEIVYLEDKLKKIWGTKVQLQANKKRGKIIIEYYSEDELERILDIMESIPKSPMM